MSKQRSCFRLFFRWPTWWEEQAVASGKSVHAEQTKTLSAVARFIVDRINFQQVQMLNEQMNERTNE